MAPRPTRSLKHEYELYVEQEIENYKESVPRGVLLGIGDEAVAALAREAQFTLTELIVWEEVDRLIFRRLRLPSYATWRRRRLKLLEELRRPEHWGLTATDAIVRAVGLTEGDVLVAGATDESQAIFLAANGCNVTAILPEADAVERVIQAAVQVGLTERVHAQVADLTSWTPGEPLTAVVVTPTALQGLSAEDRARVIQALQSATIDGGVHLVHTIAAAGKKAMTLDELQESYQGWDVTIERTDGRSRLFLARKGAA